MKAQRTLSVRLGFAVPSRVRVGLSPGRMNGHYVMTIEASGASDDEALELIRLAAKSIRDDLQVTHAEVE